jgi:hypothetical protein
LAGAEGWVTGCAWSSPLTHCLPLLLALVLLCLPRLWRPLVWCPRLLLPPVLQCLPVQQGG